ncbi:MAG: sigma 54-interacting transcriptional regulator [Planctomycetota bacterium]
MERLVRIAGRTSADEVAVGARVVLGRGDEADLRLFDETASRRHAEVRRDGDRVVVEDLASANGTRVNGARVTRAVLADGDEVAIGEVRLRFVGGPRGDRPTRIVEPAAADDAVVAAAVDPAAADPARGGGAGAVARLALVCRTAEAAAGARDVDALARGIVDLLAEALGSDRAQLLLGGREALRVAADHPAGTGALPWSRTLVRRVLTDGEAVLVRDGDDPALRGPHASLVTSPFRSTLAAPLATAEGVAGLVVLEARDAGRFTEADLEVVATVARQAGLALRTIGALSTARAELRRATSAGATAGAVEILGASPAVRALIAQVDRAAPTDATVLVRGETGTGKELVARRLHAGSARRGGPFVALNCAAIVEGLVESELFGHEKGAFTGADARTDGRIAQAAGGTLFLDEVGELSPALQAKLLRVLSDRTYTRVGGRDVLRLDCRLVAATHRDLPAMVRAGAFREDLWYRLAVVTIDTPPLRDRGDDVETLAERFLERIAARLGRRTPRLSADARAALRAHRWPGNVRELENALERAVVLSSGDTLTAADLPRPAPPVAAGAPSPAGELLTVAEAEKRAILAALAHTKGRKGEAAALLGISWPTLNRKLRDYGDPGTTGS